jgi:hypothetical protein
MLAVPADRLPAALADLDPGNRALLDLSLRRGVSDAEIGELLRKDPDEVSRGRDAVLGLLADALDLDGHDRRERVRRAIAELPDEAWSGTRSATPAALEPEAPERERAIPEDFDEPEPSRTPLHDDFDEPEPEPEASEAEEPAEKPEQKEPFEREIAPRGEVFLPREQDREKRGRSGLVFGLLGLLVVLALAATLLFGGSDDDDGGGGEPTPPPADSGDPEPPPAGGKGVALRAIGDGPGSGRFAPAGGGRYVITLKGLPQPSGAYQAWLYNNVVDAIPLGTFREGSGRLAVRLPANAAKYRFLDISQEPADNNRNHSGDTVMRARLAPLLSE